MSDVNETQERGSPFGSDYLAELIKSVANADTVSSEKQEKPQEPDVSAAASPTGDLLSSLLSNPEMLSKLPTIISTVKPILELLGGAAKQNGQKEKALPTAALSTEKPSSQDHGDRDRRAALLCAMKPYLSHDRREAIDYVVKLSKLSDILKTL